MLPKILLCCVFVVVQFGGTLSSNDAKSASQLLELLRHYRMVGAPPKAQGAPPKSPRDAKDYIMYHMARVMLKAKELKDSRNQIATTPAPRAGGQEEEGVGGVPPCVLDWLMGVLEHEADAGPPDRRGAAKPVRSWLLGDTDGGARATFTTSTASTSSVPNTPPQATTTTTTASPPSSLPQWLIDLLKKSLARRGVLHLVRSSWTFGDTDAGARATDTTPAQTTSTVPTSTTTSTSTTQAATTKSTSTGGGGGLGKLPQWLIDLLKKHGLFGGK